MAGGGIATLLVYYAEVPMEIAAIWGVVILAVYTYLAGTCSTWARDELAAGKTGLLRRLLSGLGMLLFTIGITG